MLIFQRGFLRLYLIKSDGYFILTSNNFSSPSLIESVKSRTMHDLLASTYKQMILKNNARDIMHWKHSILTVIRIINNILYSILYSLIYSIKL